LVDWLGFALLCVTCVSSQVTVKLLPDVQRSTADQFVGIKVTKRRLRVGHYFEIEVFVSNWHKFFCQLSHQMSAIFQSKTHFVAFSPYLCILEISNKSP
jgi:hypothetical protein